MTNTAKKIYKILSCKDFAIRGEEIDKAVDYIAKNRIIRDVLISGGDPLTLCDEKLEEIIAKLRKIEHVEVIRIGTRVPVVLPVRITHELLNMLKKVSACLNQYPFQSPERDNSGFCQSLYRYCGCRHFPGEPECSSSWDK